MHVGNLAGGGVGGWQQMNGTVVGAPTFAAETSYSTTNNAASFGTCVSLNGSSQSVGIPSGPGPLDLVSGGPFTALARVRTTTASGVLIALSCFVTSTSNWYIGVNAGVPRASIGVTGYQGSASIADGAWHWLALTLNNTALALYVDGTSVATATTGTYSVVGGAAAIGQRGNGAFYWNGQIDEVAVYDALLTGAALAPSAPIPNTDPFLRALYHLEAGGTDSRVPA